VLMFIASVVAESGFATGAGVSGAFAVVGCGVSGFLFPHILVLHGHKTPAISAGAGPGCETLYIAA